MGLATAPEPKKGSNKMNPDLYYVVSHQFMERGTESIATFEAFEQVEDYVKTQVKVSKNNRGRFRVIRDGKPIAEAYKGDIKAYLDCEHCELCEFNHECEGNQWLIDEMWSYKPRHKDLFTYEETLIKGVI